MKTFDLLSRAARIGSVCASLFLGYAQVEAKEPERWLCQHTKTKQIVERLRSCRSSEVRVFAANGGPVAQPPPPPGASQVPPGMRGPGAPGVPPGHLRNMGPGQAGMPPQRR